MSESSVEKQAVATERVRDRRGWLIGIAIAVIVLDRLTKWAVASHIALGSAITVLPRVFRISHVENPGAAFSLFWDTGSPQAVRWSLIAFSAIVAVVVLGFLLRMGRRITPSTLALALILGGAIGNSYDRIRYGYVVDFLEVHIIHYHWPDFNVADSAIVIGGLLLLWDAFRGSDAG